MARIKRRLIADEDKRRRAATLGEMAAARLDIFCWCNRCGHNATIATATLLAEMGPHVAVPEIGAGLRCSGCGSKDVATRPAWPSLGPVARHG